MEAKKKTSLAERIFTLISLIPVIFLEIFFGYNYAISHPLNFILILVVMGTIIFLYMDAQKKEDDDWLDKILSFQLGVFIACLILSIMCGFYEGIKNMFSGNPSVIEQTEQYEECLKKYHYNKDFCSNLEPFYYKDTDIH